MSKIFERTYIIYEILSGRFIYDILLGEYIKNL